MTRLVLRDVRLTFPNLFNPEQILGEGTPKYSTTILIPKSDTEAYKALKQAEEDAIEAKWGDKRPKTVASIIRDGDEHVDTYPERAGHWFMSPTAWDPFKPGVVDKKRNPVLDQSEVYSGVYAWVSVNSFAYDRPKNGVSFGLGNVMVLGYGESLMGGVSPEDEFADFAEDEDQESLI